MTFAWKLLDGTGFHGSTRPNGHHPADFPGSFTIVARTGTFHKYLGSIPDGLRPSRVDDRATDVFAIPMRDVSWKTSFEVKRISEKAVTYCGLRPQPITPELLRKMRRSSGRRLYIIGSDRRIKVSGGKFQDDLKAAR